MGVFFNKQSLIHLFLTIALLTLTFNTMAARFSDITNTKHNLGSSGINPDAGSSEICVFCHTPHGSSTAPATGPLWNRSISPGGYTTYEASTLDVLDGTVSNGIRSLPDPNGNSKLCLSCHDGTLAVASGTAILNAPGSGAGGGIGGTVNPLSTNKNLGTDLTNDHPISVTFDQALDTRDGEMRSLDANQQYSTHIGRREDGQFTLPLQSTGTVVSGEPGQVQCTTCHDPHISGFDDFTDTDTPSTNTIKFLRTNRFQTTAPVALANVQTGDIVCLYCHTKGDSADGFASWKDSAHANPTVADERYNTAAATEREFPDGIRVWEAACLNCHDTHTANGQKKLLRVNSGISNPPGQNTGSQENTCYQCHDTTGNSILNAATGTVPDIKTEFSKAVHMPITTGDQPATSEQHNINNADFIEDADNHGKNINSRHAECTDCHNPHRLTRNKRFNANADGLGDASLRTHTTGANETTVAGSDGREGNVASGVLRGAWGVDLASPTTFKNGLSTDWPQPMTAGDFEVKSGDPGTKTLAQAETANHLTREYQLCFKCHSSYGYNYGNQRSSTGPSVGATGGSTTIGNANSMTNFTNVAAEFLSVDATNPPSNGTDQGEETRSGTACGGVDCNPVGTGPQTGTNNHRSWHPVVFPTGRDRAERNMSGTGAVNMKAPWDDNIGKQTMHCSDCHGGENSYFAVDQNPDASINNVQGPHGSASKFLLKSDANVLWEPGQPAKQGTGGTGTNLGNQGTVNKLGFCGNCHQPQVSTNGSGLNGGHSPNGNMGGEACMNCHIAVPHGWKNKQFLVNLLCVGPEGGQGAGCTPVGDNYDTQTIAPYYIQSRLRVNTWQPSGSWTEASCENGANDMQGSCPESG